MKELNTFETNFVELQQHPLKQKTENKPLDVLSIVRSRILQGTKYGLESDTEDAFYVSDIGDVIRQHSLFKRKLPRVEPFYAMKCNPDPIVLRALNALGTGFDCASKGEIQAVLDMGVDPSRIIYANPCKQVSHLRYAAAHNVRMMTFDNAEELVKIAQHHPAAQLVLRILTDDSHSLCKLSLKFGASLDAVSGLLLKAKELGLEVIGISFHVGSGCFSSSAFSDAVLRARKAFDVGAALGFQFHFLDIGGGFPGNKSTGLQFDDIVNVLTPALDQHFPDVRIIAEPGRFFVSAAFTLCVSVVSKRVIMPTKESVEQDLSYMYYVNDGMYGSFNCLMFDHATVNAQVIVRNGQYVLGRLANEPTFRSSIWGPTCDSIDCIGRDVMLPELNVGDWLIYEDMGAYTMAAASTFNGFKRSNVIYINTEM